MKYHITEEYIHLGDSYQSLTPTKVTSIRHAAPRLISLYYGNYKKDILEYKYYFTKQVKHKKIISLYIDDVELYKRIGGKTGNFIKKFESKDFPTWESLSGIQPVIMPTCEDFHSERANGIEDSLTLIIDQLLKDDTLTIEVINCSYSQSRESLTKVVSIGYEYYQSWLIEKDERDAKRYFKNRYFDMINRTKDLNKDNLDSFVLDYLKPSAGDSRLEQIAKSFDCKFIHSIYPNLTHLQKHEIPNIRKFYGNNIVINHIDWDDYWSYWNKLYSDCKLCNPYDAKYENELTRELLYQEKFLNQATDKQWAEKELEEIKAKWESNCINREEYDI